MTTLSILEKQKLSELYKTLSTVKNSHTENADNILDFIHKQFEINTEEKSTLQSARDHFEIENKAMLEAFDIVELLVEHFKV